MNDYISKMHYREMQLDDFIREKNRILKRLPKDEIRCYKKGNSFKWYVVSKKKDEESGKEVPFRNYLRKTDRKLAEKLALKGMIEQEIIDAEKELKAVRLYLKYSSEMNGADSYLEKNEEYNGLLQPYFDKVYQKKYEDDYEWIQKRVPNKDYYPDGLVVPTQAGFPVRSKSERDIVNKLVKYKIAFRYEDKIYLYDDYARPDFTIRHPKTGKIFIWEHFGKMHEPEYAEKTFKKMARYYKVGFRPDKNFIATFEENNEGISEEQIELIIHRFFLDD